MNQDERQERDIEIARSTAVSHLKLVPRDQPLGTPLFEAIMRLSVGVAVEAVLFRKNGDKLEVYLTKRAADDSAYPGQWHCPGSFMRPGESYADVFKRLNERKFKAKITKGVWWEFIITPARSAATLKATFSWLKLKASRKQRTAGGFR